jgi:PAS domain S-box-containing protein
VFVPPHVQADGHEFGDDRLEFFHTIELAGENVGTVYIRSDLKEMRTRLRRYAVIVAGVMAVAGLAAFLLSRSLQGVISDPIAHLVKTAAVVASRKDYSIRAVKQGNDELGRLIDGFNEMLNQIQSRDAELQRAQELLEKRVEERTCELRQEVQERQRSEEALRQSNQRFEIVTRATSDVLWDWNMETDVVWWNENFHRLFGYPTEETGNTAESWTSRLHPGDSSRVLETLHDLIEGGENLWVGEYRFCRSDGSYAFVLDRGYVVRDHQGRPRRMIGAIQDITERKEAEAELEAAHQQLVSASRRAGMAEVATGVLHNVGNVLNSVNISATLIADMTRESKVANLGKVVALLDEHAPDLGVFLTLDPKGTQLLSYMRQLAQHLTQEQQTAITEVELLRKNIEHIKDIVAMQQSYATLSGVAEMVKITTLLEDALRMNARALERHNIQIFRQYESDPTVTVDRNKVLQILVNLIRNAKYACHRPDQAEKQVTVRVTSGDGRVQTVVIDNGVGIPRENLTRIFSHGFTTRKDGHGFGLHSGALAAKEMGGSLSVQSDGPGWGATATLELPIEGGSRKHEMTRE